ncbi:hypothetical protein [Brevibacillus sp. SKDU10]|uniref:hypothetical protein n=1 Tax=Brevibacillus sp. SKDU10 TaxID=1247872 RepID=UPI000A4CE4E2|nr:hypothetical protein [Brevibacillus sp. SKDU10]
MMGSKYLQYLCRGAVGLVAVPVLAVFSIGMYICSFVSVIGGVLYIAGIDIHISLWKFGQVSQLSSFFIAVMFGGILLLLAVRSWRLFQVSCHYVKKG